MRYVARQPTPLRMEEARPGGAVERLWRGDRACLRLPRLCFILRREGTSSMMTCDHEIRISATREEQVLQDLVDAAAWAMLFLAIA